MTRNELKSLKPGDFVGIMHTFQMRHHTCPIHKVVKITSRTVTLSSGTVYNISTGLAWGSGDSFSGSYLIRHEDALKWNNTAKQLAHTLKVREYIINFVKHCEDVELLGELRLAIKGATHK